MRIAIGGGYRTAAEMLSDVNAGLAVAYSHFADKLDRFRGMAGTDAPGAKFASAYDDAANAALWAYSDIVAAAGNLGAVASASAANHERANRASIIIPGGYMYDPESPVREQLAAKVWRRQVPPSLGGDGSGPDWWHFVADTVGHLYPDASTGELRAAGTEWSWQAMVLEEYASSCEYAAGSLAEQSSPEIHDAVAACTLLREQLESLASSFREVGRMCGEYADQVEETREAIQDIAKELLAWTIGTQIVSHGLAVFTAGASEAAGQSYQAARVAVAAARIRAVLAELMMWVTLRLGPLHMVKANAIASSTRLERLIAARAMLTGTVSAGSHARFKPLVCGRRQLQSHFKHAEALGVRGNYNRANAREFEERLQEFVTDKNTVRIFGTYRGERGVLNVNPEAGLVVLQRPSGAFWSAWQPKPGQWKNLLIRGAQ